MSAVPDMGQRATNAGARPTEHIKCAWPWGLAAIGLIYVSGCSGGGRIELISMNYRAIDPPAARPTSLGMQECYWWTDEDDRLWIAMQRQQTPLFAPQWRLDFQVSLALDKLPAGEARNYRVGRRELRARLRLGPWEGRFVSRAGIIAVYRKGGDKLRGSMRVQASRVTTRLLGGWSKPTRYLMLGSILAVHDEERGRTIAEATESAGWGRDDSVRGGDEGRQHEQSSTPASAPTTAEMSP